MKVPTTIQMQLADNAAATLCTMLAYYKRYVPMEEVRTICPASRNGTPSSLLMEAASAYGLECESSQATIDELKRMKMPVIVLWKRRYYTIVKGFSRGRVALSDPAKGEYEITEEKFAKDYAGLTICMKPGSEFHKEGHPEKLSVLLMRRLEGTRRQLGILLFVNLAAVLLNLAFVEGIRRILEEGTFDGMPWWAIWVAITLETIILLLFTTFSVSKTLIVGNASRRSAASSGSRMFKHLFQMPMQFFDQISAGELIQRMENNTTLDRSLILTLVPRVIDVVMAVAYLFLVFSYNFYVASACLLVEVIYLIAMRAQRRSIAIRSRSMVTSSGNMNAAVLNSMGTIETIKVSGTERVIFRLWKESQIEFQNNSRNNLRVNAMTQVISGIHGVLSNAVLLFVGAHFIILGSFDAASMVAMQMVVGRVGNSLSNCLNTMNNLQSMRTNIERVEDLNRRKGIDEVPLDSTIEADKLRGDLVLEHVDFRYNPVDPLAVRDVSFTVHPGEVYAIVGRTGCGKSTLLKVIADLYAPTSGELTYSGLHRNEIPDVVFRASVVTVDQEVMMFQDTVRANLKMWDDTIENYAMVLAARDAQIHSRIIREHDGYDTVMRENGKGFSGGELQRLELARALEREPTLLLLDEFTSALDTLTEERVMDAIRATGTTCIIVAHRLSTIRDADQILVMDKGRIVARGTHEELMSECDLYHELVSMG